MELLIHNLKTKAMNTKIIYNEGSYQFKVVETPLNFHLGGIKTVLKQQYEYRPTTETLWVQVFQDDVEVARFQYDVEADVLFAITKINIDDFKKYCEQVCGIQDADVSEVQHSFYCKTKTAKMNSFLQDRFTAWKDDFNLNKEFVGYELRLGKLDLHNSSITNNFFSHTI